MKRGYTAHSSSNERFRQRRAYGGKATLAIYARGHPHDPLFPGESHSSGMTALGPHVPEKAQKARCPSELSPRARSTDGRCHRAVRDIIFFSHATPNDNEFVRWLGTRLTGHGYKVWADIFDLAGGTPFWISIEEALRKRALKVVFVVSKASCEPSRSGVRNEISVADAIKKSLKDPEFIIPVRIDDVPFDEFPIQIHQLNAIDFTAGWGAKLAVLVDTLTKAKVPRTVTDLGAEFDRWRQVSVRSDVVVQRGEEPLLTSILPIQVLPDEISFYEYDGEKGAFEDAVRSLPYPSAMHPTRSRHSCLPA